MIKSKYTYWHKVDRDYWEHFNTKLNDMDAAVHKNQLRTYTWESWPKNRKRRSGETNSLYESKRAALKSL